MTTTAKPGICSVWRCFSISDSNLARRCLKCRESSSIRSPAAIVRVPEAHKMAQAVMPNVINHLRSVFIYAFVIRSAAKFVEPVTHHSCLNATIGSTLAEGRVGKKQAAKAVEQTSSPTEKGQ